MNETVLVLGDLSKTPILEKKPNVSYFFRFVVLGFSSDVYYGSGTSHSAQLLRADKWYWPVDIVDTTSHGRKWASRVGRAERYAGAWAGEHFIDIVNNQSFPIIPKGISMKDGTQTKQNITGDNSAINTGSTTDTTSVWKGRNAVLVRIWRNQ